MDEVDRRIGLAVTVLCCVTGLACAVACFWDLAYLGGVVVSVMMWFVVQVGLRMGRTFDGS